MKRGFDNRIEFLSLVVGQTFNESAGTINLRRVEGLINIIIGHELLQIIIITDQFIEYFKLFTICPWEVFLVKMLQVHDVLVTCAQKALPLVLNIEWPVQCLGSHFLF